MIDWIATENAIQAWFVAATGLEGKHVIWSQQPLPRQARPYATLHRTSLRDLAPFDEVIASYDEDAPAGEEVQLRTYGPRHIVVSCNVYSDAIAGAGTASEYIEEARSSLSKPSVLRTLRLAGLGLVSRSGTRDLSVLVETAFESRAQFDVTFNVVDSVTDTTTYVETASVSGPG